MIVLCCVLSGRGLWDELITRPEGPTDRGAWLCVIKYFMWPGGRYPLWAEESETMMMMIIIMIIIIITPKGLLRVS
jgi:hypothetical protein